MLVMASVAKDTSLDRIVIEAPQAESWLGAMRDIKEVSLRFAAAPVSEKAYLVIGLRVGGRGIDLLIKADECAVFRSDPSLLVVRTQSAEYPIAFADVLFDDFLQKVYDMHRELPDHFVWAALYDVFADD